MFGCFFQLKRFSSHFFTLITAQIKTGTISCTGRKLYERDLDKRDLEDHVYPDGNLEINHGEASLSPDV